jgi:hypothetical protein
MSIKSVLIQFAVTVAALYLVKRISFLNSLVG